MRPSRILDIHLQVVFLFVDDIPTFATMKGSHIFVDPSSRHKKKEAKTQQSGLLLAQVSIEGITIRTIY
jgi:hypothetical protein